MSDTNTPSIDVEELAKQASELASQAEAAAAQAEALSQKAEQAAALAKEAQAHAQATLEATSLSDVTEPDAEQIAIDANSGVVEDGSSIAEEVTEAANQVVETVSETTSEATSGASSLVQNVVETVKENTSEAAQATGEAASQAVEVTTEAAGAAVDTTKEVAGEAVDATKDAVSGLLDKIKDTTENVVTQVQGSTETAQVSEVAGQAVSAATGGAIDPFVFQFAIFVMAIFVGYYVVWSVTPALHTPLMAVTNAISSVIVVGAILAVGIQAAGVTATTLGFIALVLASVNIFGGFLVTQRMLAMYKKKER